MLAVVDRTKLSVEGIRSSADQSRGPVQDTGFLNPTLLLVVNDLHRAAYPCVNMYVPSPGVA